MKYKNWGKIVLDIVMALIMVLMFKKNVISMEFHEVGGLFVCFLFLVHKLVNWKWIKGVTKRLFSRGIPGKTRLSYLVDVLLLIAVFLILISGVLISKTVLLSISSADSAWKIVHYSASAFSLILIGIHIGLHWGFVSGMLRKAVKLPRVLAVPFGSALAALIVIYGGYSVATSSFSEWIAMPVTAVAAPDQLEIEGAGGGQGARDGSGKHGEGGGGEKSEFSAAGAAGVVAAFSSIIGLFAAVTYYLEKLIRRKRKLSKV